MATQIQQLRFRVDDEAGQVSALLARPRGARWLLVLGHGAGAGMRHPFMDGVADRLAKRRVATFRYQFPYMEAGKKRPNPQPTLEATVRSAIKAATRAAPKLPVIAGGKSMGGRMTSLAAASRPLPGVRGLVFLGFPLHAANRPSSTRGAHLEKLRLPMLFLQGTRDALANLKLMRPLCAGLDHRATLHVVDGGDHSFGVPKRAQRSSGEVLDELAGAVADWAESAL